MIPIKLLVCLLHTLAITTSFGSHHTQELLLATLFAALKKWPEQMSSFSCFPYPLTPFFLSIIIKHLLRYLLFFCLVLCLFWIFILVPRFHPKLWIIILSPNRCYLEMTLSEAYVSNEAVFNVWFFFFFFLFALCWTAGPDALAVLYSSFFFLDPLTAKSYLFVDDSLLILVGRQLPHSNLTHGYVSQVNLCKSRTSSVYCMTLPFCMCTAVSGI